MFDGILVVDKPQGMTSHDVVDFIRRRFNMAKVGHCGTLDPIATGVLVILLGDATKMASRYLNDDKKYLCTMKLGVSTDTQDAEGKTISDRSIDGIMPEKIKKAVLSFKGETQQIPPMISAKHYNGVRLYKLARQGIEVKRFPNKIHIYDIKILSIDIPLVEFVLESSKGTYIRTLCHDIGEKLGCGAHMHKLRRLASGSFKAEDAHTLEELKTLNMSGLKNIIRNDNFK
ncbi:MAG: tRNA pseudouridine(55) synthase TruB [Candidatus Omnitrophica bacterium]|nr:tRNA pseudouridine(55) synthase TruB [Candidatus Omnitrophota bacterium]